MKHLQTVFNIFFFCIIVLVGLYIRMFLTDLNTIYQYIIKDSQTDALVMEFLENSYKDMDDLKYNQEQCVYMAVNAQLKSDLNKKELDALTETLIEVNK